MFIATVTAAVVAVTALAAWCSARVSARRERQLVEARRRRVRAAWEFETQTGRYAPRATTSPWARVDAS